MTSDPIVWLPFALLFLAVLGLWIGLRFWIAALVAAVVAGYFTGAVTGFAGGWIALLAASAFIYRSNKSSANPASPPVISGAVFTLLALAMGLALLPGFPRTAVVPPMVFSPGAYPYSIGMGFPKVAVAIVILGLVHDEAVRSWRELGSVLWRALPIYLLTVTAVMFLSLALGYVRFDPKWTSLFLIWAPINLIFTCLSEEAFFRGFVQRELAELGRNRARAGIAALAFAAVLYGLAHLGGGWKYALLAAVAGVGYGYAYHRTRRVEASMAVHFGVNAVHFLLFTYPALSAVNS